MGYYYLPPLLLFTTFTIIYHLYFSLLYLLYFTSLYYTLLYFTLLYREAIHGPRRPTQFVVAAGHSIVTNILKNKPYFTLLYFTLLYFTLQRGYSRPTASDTVRCGSRPQHCNKYPQE